MRQADEMIFMNNRSSEHELCIYRITHEYFIMTMLHFRRRRIAPIFAKCAVQQLRTPGGLFGIGLPLRLGAAEFRSIGFGFALLVAPRLILARLPQIDDVAHALS